ncbi:hypothetical protein GCM10023191_005860 [Actinoallomurus oryzae]|uniref:Uncharacterized protein n=1 Tax=Actinoallomurus oryzae TaxID=502180 RepID=A0ABP8PBQ8_9ACTN
MPFLVVSSDGQWARTVEILVRGFVQMLVLLVVITAFVPLVAALLFWPLIGRERVRELLELFRGWTLGVLQTNDADQQTNPPETMDSSVLRTVDSDAG